MQALTQLLKRLVRFVVKWIFYGIILSIIWVWAYRYINPPTTPLMIKRVIAARWNNEIPNTINQQWVSYNQISPNAILAIIASEDQNFPFHNGFDFEAINKAIEHNKAQTTKAKPRIKGASTISQQTAKNVFLWDSRSWLRKALETYFTVLIEALWSKQRILEIYLNVAETADMTFGIEAAAQKYFKKSAISLPADESALIAASLPNPRVYNPLKPTKYINDRKKWTLRQMSRMGGKQFLNLIK
jgi:monofunctional biosynthetic peptidoglycan transglycosylase